MDKIYMIRNKDFEQLPKTTGVYFFYEKYPTPIYIGKAINIKSRVKNHFQQPSYRDNLFINKVNKIGYIETNSEIEALLLEANLIKKYQPKFNVVWRDDKNYFYVAITKTDKPIIYITHQKNNNADYIGPFVEGTALKKTLKFLRRVFPYYTSNQHPKNKCTWCHLGLCPGPDPDLKLYKNNIKKLILVLQGKRNSALYNLKREMALLSKQNKFEEAGTIRDKIYSLQQIMSHSHIIQSQEINAKTQNEAESLSKIIGIKSIKKIECYDISNIQGKFATGSMVVFTNGQPDKSQYKKFKVQMKNEPNDIAMLKEIISRRLNHPDWKYPDVMLIDGGKAQLNIAIKTKNQKIKTKKIKIISIAKGKQELFIENRKEPIPLKNLPQEAKNIILKLDDEAHRFAITYYKKLHKKYILE